MADVFTDILLVPSVARLPKPPAPLAPVPGISRDGLERLRSHPTRWEAPGSLPKVGGKGGARLTPSDLKTCVCGEV
jgi:hypothetical protein